jgi:hypothetical protein
MKLLILAAGLGSRFGGIKQIAGVGPCGETLLEYNLYDARGAGFSEAVFLIRKEIERDFRETVLSRIEGHIPVSLAYQSVDSRMGRSKPWGTGHALLCAREAMGREPFAVINADDFYGPSGFSAVARHLAASDDLCLAGYRLGGVVPKSGSVSRAVCGTDDSGYLTNIEEHVRVEWVGDSLVSRPKDNSSVALSPESFASMNLWGLNESVFSWAQRLFSEFLQSEGPAKGAEFYLPFIMGEMAAAKAARFRVLPVREEYFGLTNPADIQAARNSIASRIRRGDYPSPLWNPGGGCGDD